MIETIRNGLFIAALVSVTVGCFLERMSLGFIVPGVIIMALAASAYLVPAKGESS